MNTWDGVVVAAIAAFAAYSVLTRKPAGVTWSGSSSIDWSTAELVKQPAGFFDDLCRVFKGC
jgi:hypothetical protein